LRLFSIGLSAETQVAGVKTEFAEARLKES